jgi:hypothetical protein
LSFERKKTKSIIEINTNRNFDVIELNTTKYTWPNLGIPLAKLVSHDFLRADINEMPVVKGNLRLKNPIENLRTTEAGTCDDTIIYQMILPSDLSLLPIIFPPQNLLAVDDLVSIIQVDELVEKKKKIAEYLLKIREDKSYIESMKSWLSGVINQLKEVNSIKTFYRRTLSEWAGQLALDLEKLDLTKTSYGKPLNPARYRIGGQRYLLNYVILVHLAAEKGLLIFERRKGPVIVTPLLLQAYSTLGKEYKQQVWVDNVAIENGCIIYAPLA